MSLLNVSKKEDEGRVVTSARPLIRSCTVGCPVSTVATEPKWKNMRDCLKQRRKEEAMKNLENNIYIKCC